MHFLMKEENMRLWKELNRFERGLWLTGVVVIAASFVISGGSDWLNLIASLIGVTALIFVAKGYVIGQVLTVVFAVFYGIISWFFRYYGEMITYLGMTAPIAAMAVVSWMKNPYEGSRVVKVHRISRREAGLMLLMAVVVTAGFYFILKVLGNASLFVSTLSVTTSFIASYLTWRRNPWYALGYAANDVILIILWVQASMIDVNSLPMVICFIMFLANDLYGFYNWRKMEKQQKHRKNH